MNEPLTFEAFYPHSPERVWQALTDPAVLAQWLLPTNFESRVGFRFRFGNDRKNPLRRPIWGTVLRAETGRLLAYTWDERLAGRGDDGTAGTPSVVTWTLEPRPGGTRVRLEHQMTSVAAVDRDEPYVLLEADANWRYAMHASLPLLLRRLATEARRPPTPIVYVEEAPGQESTRRAGFRQGAELVMRGARAQNAPSQEPSYESDREGE